MCKISLLHKVHSGLCEDTALQSVKLVGLYGRSDCAVESLLRNSHINGSRVVGDSVYRSHV